MIHVSKSAVSLSRVLLVNINRYDQPYPVYPLGLACIDGALRSAGHPGISVVRLRDWRCMLASTQDNSNPVNCG